MGFLIDLFWIILIVFALPYILVGAILGIIFSAVGELFYLPVLWASVSAGGFGVLAWMNSTPDPSRPWESLIEVISQAHFLGAPTSAVFFGLSLALFVLSGAKCLIGGSGGARVRPPAGAGSASEGRRGLEH